MLLTISFAGQKFVILVKSSLSFFFFFLSFMDPTSGVVSKNSSPNPWTPRFFSCVIVIYIFISLIVLQFAIRSVIHFALIFMKDVRPLSRLMYSDVNVQLFQYCLLKIQSFLHWIAFAHLSKISWLYLCDSVPGLYSVPLICFSVLSHQYQRFL